MQSGGGGPFAIPPFPPGVQVIPGPALRSGGPGWGPRLGNCGLGCLRDCAGPGAETVVPTWRWTPGTPAPRGGHQRPEGWGTQASTSRPTRSASSGDVSPGGGGGEWSGGAGGSDVGPQRPGHGGGGGCGGSCCLSSGCRSSEPGPGARAQGAARRGAAAAAARTSGAR